jgi:hypothetical protein
MRRRRSGAAQGSVLKLTTERDLILAQDVVVNHKSWQPAAAMYEDRIDVKRGALHAATRHWLTVVPAPLSSKAIWPASLATRSS